MQFSRFGQKFTRNSGILQLMDDLGNALNSDKPVNMLGGGNPARIAEVNAVYREVLQQLVDNTDGVESIGNYSTPQGDARFINALVKFFNAQYGWNLTADNIALTNGSQNAFFYLFNLFGGRFDDDSDKSILLPLAPEYIGYADAHIDKPHFVAVPPAIEAVEHNGQSGFFKYRVDFDALEQLPALREGKIGAICCSRPTNPTGNVLTDDEVAGLAELAAAHEIPLIVDGAYGLPFPGMVYTAAQPTWNEHLVLCLSLSKFGLPACRTGIVIAKPELIRALAGMNAVVNLAPSSFGAMLTADLVRTGEILRLGREVIRPCYQRKRDLALTAVAESFAGLPYRVHVPEGAFFLWLWFPGLPITSRALYERLKARGVLVVSGDWFFPGLAAGWSHTDECLRLTYSQDEAEVRRGIALIADEIRRIFPQPEH